MQSILRRVREDDWGAYNPSVEHSEAVRRIPYGSPKRFAQQKRLPCKSIAQRSFRPATLFGPVVQLVRTLACHARGQGFESPSGRQEKLRFLIGVFLFRGDSNPRGHEPIYQTSVLLMNSEGQIPSRFLKTRLK